MQVLVTVEVLQPVVDSVHDTGLIDLTHTPHSLGELVKGGYHRLTDVHSI